MASKKLTKEQLDRLKTLTLDEKVRELFELKKTNKYLPFETYKEFLNKNDIKSYLKHHTLYETMVYFGMSKATFQRLLDSYQIKKEKKYKITPNKELININSKPKTMEELLVKKEEKHKQVEKAKEEKETIKNEIKEEIIKNTDISTIEFNSFKDLDLSVLDSLSDEEKELALKVLEEYANSGTSAQLNNLLLEDYAEVPVDITTFLHDLNYLGRGLTTDEGKFTVFPYWEKTLKELFPNNIDTAYNTLILSGAIGLGKSFIAVIAMLYMLYRMLCLKDPYKHYGLQPIDHITFSIMNITLDAAKGVAWSKIQELLQLSPWFMAHGRLSKSLNPEWQPNSNVELILGSQPRHVIGRAVFCSFEDEISFQNNADIEKQKKKARELVSSIDARMSSRFMKGVKLPTLHIIASSKRTDQSFLETYIDMKKKNDSKTTLIIDEPQWVIRTDKDSSQKFAVAVGNKFLDSEVLPLSSTEQDYDIYREKGYQILMVPIGYHEAFIDDINIALTDIAGISTSSNTNYISGVRWTKCKNPNIQNPFVREILEIGNDPEDTAQYYDFFDLSAIPPDLKSKPLYIHLDMSISGDKTGIGGVFIKGKKPPVEGQPDSKELFYRVAFNVSIKAPKGRQVSFEKNRQFIYWLREQGFNIKGISMDTFQSAAVMQSLQAHGFKCNIVSVDRTTPIPGSENRSKVCIPYQIFRTAIYEERLEVYPTTLLTAEIVGLVRDGNGKIDHSPAGINSKDSSDAICGSIYNASLHVDEFAYDYGESSEQLLRINNGLDYNDKDEFTLNLEEELKKLHGSLGLNRVQNRIHPSDSNEKRSDYILFNDIIIL